MPHNLPTTTSRLLGALAIAGVLILDACGGGGSGNNNLVPVTPTPTPTPPISTAACPTSGSAPASVAFHTSAATTRRYAPVHGAQQFVPNQLVVTYEGAAPDIHASRIADLAFPGSAVRARVIGTGGADVDALAQRIRSMPGVKSVSRVSYRSRMTAAANDPYYVGFTGTSAPYFETATIPGQWDMHAIDMDGAWAQFTSAPVVGAPIAIVDTGVDVTHPELITPAGVAKPKVARTQCYVTFPASSGQTTGPYVTDTDGHGTNVAGIADGDTNNSFAFAGVAFDAPLLAYRIFPTTPAGGCEVSNPPAQCDATSTDEASAINDAVAHGAKVINLSLGAAPPCSSGDPEYQAVENAIAHGVVVVAASGNGAGNPAVGQPYLDCPAADPGVIAVGASALNDTNPLSIFEYVASYSNYVSNHGTASGGAFLVAPGGDPCPTSTGSCDDSDNLHWIEHIYSSTAVQTGQCASTAPANEAGDCRIEIAGTSQATPHVVGVVSLMLAKNPSLTPSQIAAGLCATADNIGDTKQGCGRVNAAAAVSWAATH
ncbi:MAG TPA: S8 family serine peptidase [Candidatus Baltobacteraceae bacterium]|nr:S8 family serine peptidase [Candidatus Baltobacteraceae bacterium]